MLRLFRTRAPSIGAALVWAALLSPFPFSPHLSEIHAEDCPDEDSADAVEQVLEDPDPFVGCRLMVQGTLYRMQGVHQVLYSITLASGQNLEIRPWAPDETVRSPARDDSGEEVRSMASYVGQELRVEGRLVRERSGRVVLEASIVEELKREPE